MIRKITAAVIHAANDPYKFEDVELASPKADEVLVKIKACGLCHTDDFGRTLGLPMPLVLGHEGAGIIEEIGSDVRDFSVGDHVAFSYETAAAPFYAAVQQHLSGSRYRSGCSRHDKPM